MRPVEIYKINSPQVIHQSIDGEIVLINLEKGFYYSLNSAGSLIWDAIERNCNLSTVLQLMEITYSGEKAQIEDAVTGFIKNLVDEELIVPLESCPPGSSALFQEQKLDAAPVKQSFSHPRLEAFSDLQELLLLDPIHEVSETGWPHKA